MKRSSKSVLTLKNFNPPKFNRILLLLIGVLCFAFQNCKSQEESKSASASEIYTFKKGSSNGIGKWFMGREIAYVMGYQGMAWLNRPDREKEENVSLLIDNMDIQSDDVIADIGAGSGYHVFKMAPMANQGTIYAVDIQPEMLAEMKRIKKIKNAKNVEIILGGEKSPNLPANKIDKILMVDVYHEFNFPFEMLQSIKTALKENGKIYLIEYRGEDQSIPIKTIHKMTENQAVKELEFAGFQLVENIENLPWQHCMIFKKKR
jgi:precorrin-6B methylase 2